MGTAATPSSKEATLAPASPDGSATDRGEHGPGQLLRAEGAALFVLGVASYAQLGLSWWLFVALLLVPDIGLVGYAAGPRAGALTYNFTHTLVTPMGLALIGFLVGGPLLLGVACIWAAHIGIDRAFGFGLKYATGFRDTHLQRVS